MLVEKQSLSLKQPRKIRKCCVRPICCTVVKRGNRLLQKRPGCVGWNVV